MRRSGSTGTILSTTRLRTRTFPEFVQKLIVFAELPAALNVAQMWLIQKSKLVLREGLVEDLPAEWLSPLRAFRLSHAREIGANPDRRIHEDAKHFAERTIERLVQVVEHQE
jgi:putative ATP-binding cassette transporter